MILFLTGFMGCGKSSIGRKLAARIGYDFVDLDNMIEQSAGRSVSEIFAQSGEEAFRRLESEALGSIDPRHNAVVATGGGAPCRQENIDHMRQTGTIVYLRQDTRTLFERLRKSKTPRPKINAMDDSRLGQYIEELLAQREKWYMQASEVIECTNLDDNQIINRIIELSQRSDINPEEDITPKE